MYKSPLDNFNDFYNQVFEKEAVSKQNKSKVEKSYFEYKNNQVYLRIKHDAINHGDKKHRLSAEEWKNVLENILNIENAAISNKQYSNDNVALIKVATPNGKYGVSIQFANGTNQILILIGTTGDVTTVLHESAHYFLNMLEELERVPDHSPKVDDVLFAIRKTLKNDGTPFTRSQHEKFAKGFEHYIYTGNARSNIFKEIYEDIKNLLKNIYEFVQKGQYFTTGEGALTEEEMKNFNNVFDEIFKLENKTVKERVFAKVLALDEKEEDGFFKELTLFLSLFWQYRHLFPNS